MGIRWVNRPNERLLHPALSARALRSPGVISLPSAASPRCARGTQLQVFSEWRIIDCYPFKNGLGFFSSCSWFIFMRILVLPEELYLPYVTKFYWNSCINRWSVLLKSSYVSESWTSVMCVIGGSLANSGLCLYHLCFQACKKIVTCAVLKWIII